MNVKIRVMVVLLLLIIVLTSCEEKEELEVKELSFRITWDIASERGDTLSRVVSRFNNIQDEVNVTLLGGNEDFGEISELVINEEGPEVFVLPYRFVQYFGESGDIQGVDKIIEAELDNHYESILDMASVDNVIYGVPWVGHSMSILYNESILEEAGVDPSSIIDFDTFSDALTQIENNTDKAGIGLVGADHHDLSWMTTQFIHSFGGTLVDEDKETITINSVEAKAGLDYYINVLGSCAQDDWENHTGLDVMENFKNQEVGFEIQGPWGVTDIWKAGYPFEVGTISFTDIGGYSEVGPLMLSIRSNVNEDEMDAIESFIKYMSSEQAMEIIMSGEYSPKTEQYYPFRVPVRKDMEDLHFFTMFPEFVNFVDGFKNPSISSPIPAWTEIHELYYQPRLHEVIVGDLSLDDFLEQIENEGNKMLD